MPILSLRLAATALFASAALFAADVKTDFDPAVDLAKFKTYSFIAGIEMTKTGLLADPTVRERLKNFIAGGMEMRGLKEVPKDEKYDLAVRYWVARKAKTEEHVILSSDPYMWGGYPPYWGGAWGGFYEEYVVNHFVEGTLIVDLIDPGTKELVWRTYLRQKIEDRPKAYAELKKGLQKSLAMFPPSDEQKAQMKKDREKLAKKYQ
jgi:hypothetical protein